MRGTFLDISKPFDKVWHEGLIFKLKIYGIEGNLLKLLENYLTDRLPFVVLNDKMFMQVFHKGLFQAHFYF